MKKRTIVLIVLALCTSSLVYGLIAYVQQRAAHERFQAAHEQRIKRELVALANDDAALRKRVAEIKKHEHERWTDGRVGITGDGYVFCYDMHESHGTDAIDDISIFYLPDEQRFIINRKHYCCDLSKFEQPKTKAELPPFFRWGMPP